VNDTPLPRVEKSGRSRCISVLGLVAWGDASIAAAEKAGGVTRIHHVDIERMSYLGLFYSFTTVVYGE